MEQEVDKVRVFKDGSVLEIKLGLNYYNRMAMVLMDHVKDKTPEDLEKAVEQIESGKIEDEWTLHYETLLFFMRACQDYAEANDLFELITPEEFQQRTLAAQQSVENAAELSPELDTGLDSHS